MELNKLPILFALSGFIFLQSCEKNKEFEIEGYLPIFEHDLESSLALNEGPQMLRAPGKIYIYENYLFVVERAEGKEGIHVINNTNKSNPVREAFYGIPGCSEISIRNQILYTNFGNGLLTIDIGNVNNAQYLNYTRFPETSEVQPSRLTSKRDNKGRIIYQCPDDTDDGFVVGWKYGIIKGRYCSIN